MRTLVTTVTLSLVSSSAVAQCFDTAYGTPLGVQSQMFGDFELPIQSIGFAFPIGATTYTDVVICDKGYVWLSNAGLPASGGVDYTPSAAELASGSPRICALWTDIQVQGSNNGQIYIKSTPSACTITWQNAQTYGATSGLFDMQMVLHPSGEVKLLYGPGATNNSTQAPWWTGVVGISPGLGAALPAASDLSASGASANPTLYEEWLAQNTFDLANNGLLIVPTSPGYAFVPLGTPTNCASVTAFGAGCVQQDDSIFELMTTGTFDLAGSTITWFRQPNGYVVLDAIPGTFVPPGAGATVVANGDDLEQTVTLNGSMPIAGGTTTSLTVCSNGRVSLGSLGNGTGWSPDAATFLNWAEATIAASWHDYNPTLAGSGQIKFEQIGTIAYITWDGVYSYGTTSPDRFQYQFDVATGNVVVVYDTFGNVGNDHLAGYSAGGPSSGAAVDLSTALAVPANIYDLGSAGLALSTNSSPALGNSGFAFVTSDVPNLVPVGILFFGTLALPGIDLSSIGMAGCKAYTNGDVTSATFPVAGGVGSINLPIPATPSLMNLTLTSQSVAFSLATAANLVTSNGLTWTIGN